MPTQVTEDLQNNFNYFLINNSYKQENVTEVTSFEGTNELIPFTYIVLTKEDKSKATYSIPTVWYNRLKTIYETPIKKDTFFNNFNNQLSELEVEDLSVKLLKKQNTEHLINPYFSNMFSHDAISTYVKTTEEFVKDFNEYLAAITIEAKKISNQHIRKDHDLILSFKANEDFKQLIVGLNRVYPKLPKEQVFIGDTPVDPKEWEEKGFKHSVVVSVRKVAVLAKKANNLINSTLTKFKNLNNTANGDYLLKAFEVKLKETLIGSSHFLTTIYKFDTDDGIKELTKVAGEILNVLDKYKNNIGLDLNEWVCYEYSADKPPRKMLQKELDFKDTILNSYTESFVEALYAYLLRVEHTAIKPFTHKEVIEEEDDVELGSIRLA